MAYGLSTEHQAEFVAALETVFDREDGESTKDYVRRWLNVQAKDVMMRARKRAASVEVVGDVVEDQP
jgi:hypothetical protein